VGQARISDKLALPVNRQNAEYFKIKRTLHHFGALAVSLFGDITPNIIDEQPYKEDTQ
jgi:hypothetical protein